MTALVIGVGNPDRGDDGVGPEVAGQVAAMGLPGVQVAPELPPTRLLETWADADLVVVIDATHSGCPPGFVSVVDAGREALPTGTGSGSTHAFGLGAAIELARALGRLPPRLLVLGVEAADTRLGAPLSADVSAAVPRAVERVVQILGVGR